MGHAKTTIIIIAVVVVVVATHNKYSDSNKFYTLSDIKYNNCKNVSLVFFYQRLFEFERIF